MLTPFLNWNIVTSKIFCGKKAHYLPHPCTHSILYRWHMTLPFAMGKHPSAPCLHTVTSVVRVFLSHVFLLQGANELVRYVSLWENMTNQGSEYVERNVHKHKVYVQGNYLLVQRLDPLSQLCNTCWVWGFFSFFRGLYRNGKTPFIRKPHTACSASSKHRAVSLTARTEKLGFYFFFL